jgi:phospholipase C
MKAKAASAVSLSPLIDHVVIIVKENHTYDNYFGTFPNSEGDNKLGKAQNPPRVDPNHRHETWMKRATDHRYEVQYSRADIPTYFALADQYTLCDHFFSEVAGPSTPSHLMLITADAPIINNPPFSNSPTNVYDLKSLPLALQNKGLTWGNYGGYAFHYIRETAKLQQNYTRDLFVHQAAAGQLPSVSWVYGDGGSPNYSEHPTQNITPGSEWTGKQIQAIVDGGLWPRTVVFVTWDDWGGWYDHVRPFRIGQPNGWGTGYTYGFRVPLLVVSAYTPAGYVDNSDHDVGSILKFIETNFAPPGKPLGPIGPGTYADAYADNSLQAFFRLNSTRSFQRIHVKFYPGLFLKDTARRVFEEVAACGLGCWF